MNMLDLSIIIFVIIEFANVCILYFFPDSRRGNGVAAFQFWEDSKKNEDDHLFAQYMTNWVAGTKLIFICLLLVICIFGSELLKMFAVGAMILSIATYFFRLHPIIRKLDQHNQIIPKGYSNTLKKMITFFVAMFAGTLIYYIILL